MFGRGCDSSERRESSFPRAYNLINFLFFQKKYPFSPNLLLLEAHHTMPILGLAPSSTPAYPSHFDIEKVIRPNILALHPYRCARDDYQEGILLDANENALGHSIPSTSSSSSASNSNANGNTSLKTDETPDFLSLDLNRYPDPAQREIKSRIAQFRGLTNPSTGSGLDDHVFLGVGSDEVIDLLMRICVAPSRESILITPPTYGMYSVCAQVNDVGVKKVPLVVEGGVFQLDLPGVCI